MHFIFLWIKKKKTNRTNNNAADRFNSFCFYFFCNNLHCAPSVHTTFRDEHTDCRAAIIAKAGAITAEQTVVGSYWDRDTNFGRYDDFRIKLVSISYELFVTSPLAYCYFMLRRIRVYGFQEVLVFKIQRSRHYNTSFDKNQNDFISVFGFYHF